MLLFHGNAIFLKEKGGMRASIPRQVDKKFGGPQGERVWGSQGGDSVSCWVMSNSLQLHGMQPARLLCLWDSPGKNTGVGCHFCLQGIFPTWGSNQGLLNCRQILYHLSHQGILKEEIGVWNSQGRGKDKHLFFPSTFLSLNHITCFFL